VTARRLARARWWVGGLPALLVLLLLLAAGGGVGRLADGPTVVTADAALGAAPAATQPSAAPRVDLRLLVKRGGHGAPGPVFAAGSVAVLRVAPPARWWTVTGAVMAADHAERGEVYQGRAPPSAA
jgi:hypothetical protein